MMRRAASTHRTRMYQSFPKVARSCAASHACLWSRRCTSTSAHPDRPSAPAHTTVHLPSGVPEAALSYASGPSSMPLLGLTVGDALRAAARRHAARDAVVAEWQAVRWSFAELDRRVDALAAGLLSLGLQRGDRLGIWAPNCVEWLLTQLATARLGIVLVTVNPAYRPRELRYALNLVGCRALVMARGVKTSDFVAMLNEVVPELRTARAGELSSVAVPTLQHVVLIHDSSTNVGGKRAPISGSDANMHAFHHLSDGAPSRLAELHAAAESIGQSLSFDDAVNIQFTSGTTGHPKGATLTHHNIVNNGYFVGRTLALSEMDRICIPVPLYHCFGMVMGNLACVTHGATMVYPSPVFEAEAVLRTVQQERCTALYGVPSMFLAQLSHPAFASYNLSSLRTGIMAGAPCPIDVMRSVTKQMHLDQLTIAYGMTETSPVSTQSDVHDTLERRVSTVGRVHPHVEVKLQGSDGQTVPRGSVGELCTRGYSVMRGYWGDAERTKACIDAARWLHTGDLATMDEDGYVRIVGRLKDMIVRGGENIYPRELEEILHLHPHVAEAHVFGVPCERFGEAVCVWVRCVEGAAVSLSDLQAFCKDHVAYFKVPTQLRLVEAFPMTVSGKVQKYLMRAAHTLEGGAHEKRTVK